MRKKLECSCFTWFFVLHSSFPLALSRRIMHPQYLYVYITEGRRNVNCSCTDDVLRLGAFQILNEIIEFFFF